MEVVPNIWQTIIWSYEVRSELDAQIVMNCWRVACILPATCNVDFALVDEMEKNRMQEELDELGALLSKLQLGDDEMSIESYIHMKGKRLLS